MRSPEQLLKAYERATKENPLVLANNEFDNFRAAMRMSWPETSKVKTVIMDKDRLLRDGVLSPLDQKSTFHNRQAWGEHLKANDCVEVGNDLNNATQKKREIRGDFDCRAELTQATQQVMEKYGH